MSLVPHATELLFALGLDDQIVGVTHECDYPWAATELPQVTRDLLPGGLSAAEIDRAVREATLEHGTIYGLDTELLAELEPDLIVTQALCSVCAVSHDDVVKVAAEFPSQPAVVSLDPHTIGEVLADIGTIARHTDSADEAEELLEEMTTRIDRVRLAAGATDVPRVLAVEWFDPLFVGGHWVPQMIEFAGGEDVLGLTGEPSQELDWDIAVAAKPDLVIAMPCGRDTTASYDESLEHWERLATLGAERVIAVDASAYFSRPGPRLVEGLELLSYLMHPSSGIEPPEGGWREVR